MIRTAALLSLTTLTLALVTAYALTLVHRPIEAATLAFMAGIAWALGLLPTWRGWRRLMRP